MDDRRKLCRLLATRPTCSSSSPTSQNPLSLGNLPHNFFPAPTTALSALFICTQGAPVSRKTVTISQYSARLAGSSLTSRAWNVLRSSLECSSRISMPSIYNTGAQAQQTGTNNSSYTFSGSTLSCKWECPDDVRTSRILAFRRLPLPCKANPRRKQIFSKESHLNGTSEGLSSMAT